VFFIVFGLVASFLRDASADPNVPSKPVFRPSLGWVCWVRRTAGDFDGDGRRDHAVVWDRSGPNQVCDYLDPQARWHVALLLGDRRVQRALSCNEGPVFCGPEAGDLNGDGVDELLVYMCCGAIIAEWHVYQMIESRLVPFRLAPPLAAGLQPGPLLLSYISDSGMDDGFGCRTHPDGKRVLLVWTGRLMRAGRWLFERGRFRESAGVFRTIGVRTFHLQPHGRWPLGLHTESCFAPS